MELTTLQKRIALFLIGCIGVRSLFAYGAKVIPLDYLPYMGWLALLPAIGFMYIFLTGARQTGAEVFGAKIWWNNLRPVHAALYALFAYAAIQKDRSAWVYLLADVVLGLVSFTGHHLLA